MSRFSQNAKVLLRRRLASSAKPYLPFLDELFKANDQSIDLSLHGVLSVDQSGVSGELCGVHTKIALPSKDEPFLSARYAIMESGDIKPSHIPSFSAGPFRENPLYPPGLQERRYHDDPQEMRKVRVNAKRFYPPLVINTNPDTINGPPVVDKNGVVLGGNSRAMTMQLVYLSGNGYLIREAIKDSCSKGCFIGIGESLDRFIHPVLVRMVQVDARKESERARKLVRLMNMSLTQDLDLSSSIASHARLLSAEQWKQLAKFIAFNVESDQTINDYMLSSASRSLVRELLNIGVLSNQNISLYTYPESHKSGGLLNVQGRRLFLDLIMGYLAPNTKVLDRLNSRTQDIIQKVGPSIIASDCCDPEDSLLSDFRLALQAISELRVVTLKDLGRAILNTDAIGGGVFGLIKKNPTANLLLYLLVRYNRKSSVLTSGLRRYLALSNSGGSLSLFAKTPKLEMLYQSFDGVRTCPVSPFGFADRQEHEAK